MPWTNTKLFGGTNPVTSPVDGEYIGGKPGEQYVSVSLRSRQLGVHQGLLSNMANQGRLGPTIKFHNMRFVLKDCQISKLHKPPPGYISGVGLARLLDIPARDGIRVGVWSGLRTIKVKGRRFFATPTDEQLDRLSSMCQIYRYTSEEVDGIKIGGVPGKKYISCAELSRRLGVSRQRISQLLLAGRIESVVRIGYRVLVPSDTKIPAMEPGRKPNKVIKKKPRKSLVETHRSTREAADLWGISESMADHIIRKISPPGVIKKSGKLLVPKDFIDKLAYDLLDLQDVIGEQI